MSGKQGNSGRIARRVISLGSARLRLLFVPVITAWALLGVALLGVGLGAVQHAQANGDDGGVRHIVVTVNKSRTLRLPEPFASVVVGSPAIVDALPMSDHRLYIQGKQIGTTNVSVFNQSMQLAGVIDVEVTPDTGNLQEKIRASTGSSAIRVGSSNRQIVLSGVAGNAVAADRAVEVAKTMVPEGNIVNAMKVAPSQQVMLRVRFLEVGRSASREIGVNWFGANNAGNRGFATGLGTSSAGGRPAVGPSTAPGLGCGLGPQAALNNPSCVDASGNTVFSPPANGPPGLPIFNTAGTLLPTITGAAAAPFGVALASIATKGGSLDVTLTALEEKGLIRRLAEPDLIALSGDTAAFLAGGEFPVPVAQQGSIGAAPIITVQWKPFGVELTFVPTVLANGIINLRLAPSVSELDFTNPVVISGSSIPSLTKREARTTIELRDGQSFAIAGLLQARNRRGISQLPWIGSVPVLGALFRSAAYQQEETDLVVIVTPHLVAPSVPGQRLASPLDNYLPTNDVDFFLMGDMEQKKKFRDYITSGGDIQGPYGHMIRSGPALPVISAAPISAKN
jgi:pilus assembly protein CpaC